MGLRGREFYQRELAFDIGVRKFEPFFARFGAKKKNG